MTSRSDWCEDHGELVAFARALAESGELDGARGAISYFEKPWKWTDEHARWVAAGRPDAVPEP